MKRLLHGILLATVDEIDKLQPGSALPLLKQGFEHPRRTWKTLLYRVKQYCTCDPQLTGYRLYATVDLDNVRVAHTEIQDTPSKPQWFQTFQIYCAHEVSEIIFTVKDENPVSATLIGRAHLQVNELILSGGNLNKWIPLLDENRDPIGSNIHVNLQFTDVARDLNWSKGIQTPNFNGVPSTYFQQKQGCKVTLYHDAHVADDFRPKIELSRGMRFEPQRCWKDIFDAIVNAKCLVYIAGWSVYTEITLIRPSPSGLGRLTLGEILKKKAEETGVKVLVLVWDDITSKKWLQPFHKGSGVMGTHDEDTIAYFRGSQVLCARCPRVPDKGRTVVQGVESEAVFTHHQKTVVVDCESSRGNGNREIVSFVGGIDLCDGRYDTQEHSLFRTLNTVHKDDFHQPNFPGSSIQKGGPREPWHDVHCRLEGAVAWDVLTNFEQRWKKQVGGAHRLLYSRDELQQRRISVSKLSTSRTRTDDESWNVQMFRSIDAGSVADFPADPAQAAERGLVTDKGSVIDHSIQDAYVNAIRRAKNFVYIENQYFIGSSYSWKPEESENISEIGALNLIPKELSLKIVSKIEAGERFSVYIVIPMWPEGEPESAVVQEILYYQRRTMEMMYTDIAAALQRKQMSNVHPRDYLSFFCLGNREVFRRGEYVPGEKPEPGSDYIRAQISRRFMIYVHAKTMIVDDEYIIIGSANINQRSMDGGRDTEIAMGAFQPHHLSSRQHQPPKGQVYGFRMSLWYEHLAQVHRSFDYPESLECIRRVNQIAEQHWKIYSSNDGFSRDLPGHILTYPVQVTRDGRISTLSDVEKCFPDTKAEVLGSKSRDPPIPPVLTT